MIYRVEVSRDETVAAGGVKVEIIAYIDRVPDTAAIDVGRLARAPRGAWTSRLFSGGDFEELADAVAAIGAAYPEIGEIGCYEWTVDYEYPFDMPPLRKSAAGWAPGERRAPGPPPLLDWRIG
jgi:hypothetical protein